MTSFSSKSFDASSYDSYRPSYPPQLYNTIVAYHSSAGGQFGTCVDLGCGTGKSTRDLAARFDMVIGVDPSGTMMDEARKEGGKTKGGKEIEWVVAPSEQLGFLEDGSVDLVTAATSCAYFKYPETWHEIARVLKPLGTVAFFSYTLVGLGDPLSALNPILDRFVKQTSGFKGFSKEEPDFVASLTAPDDLFDKAAEARHLYVGEYYPAALYPKREKVILKVKRTWEGLEGFIRSGGFLLRYWETHPEEKEHKTGDVVTRMVRELKDEARKVGYNEEEVVTEHPMPLLLLRKAG